MISGYLQLTVMALMINLEHLQPRGKINGEVGLELAPELESNPTSSSTRLRAMA